MLENQETDTFAQQGVSPEGQAPGPTGESELSSASDNANNWEGKYKDLYDQYVRLAADFENFRKRYQQEQETMRKYGAESALHQLIPVLDNLERAGSSLNETSDPKMLYQSFRLIYNQLLEALSSIGLKRMQTIGKPFDPAYHEAVTQVENDEHPEDTVINEMQSGFMLQDKVLRPAMVTVSVKSGATSNAAASEPGKLKDNPFAQVSEGSQYTPDKQS